MRWEEGWASLTPHTSAEQQRVSPVAGSVGAPSHRAPAEDCQEGNVVFFQHRSCRACCMGRALSTVFLPAFCPGGSFPPSLYAFKVFTAGQVSNVTRVVLLRVTCRKCCSRNTQALLGGGSACSTCSTLHPPKTPAEPLGKPQVCAWHGAQHGACPRTLRHCYLQPHGHPSTSQDLRLGNIPLNLLHSHHFLVQHPLHGLFHGA